MVGVEFLFACCVACPSLGNPLASTVMVRVVVASALPSASGVAVVEKECKERREGDGRTWPRCAVPVALYRGWNRLDRRRRQDAPAMWQMKRERGTQHHVTARHIIGWLEDRHHSIAFIDYDAGAERCDSLPGKQRCPLLVSAV